MQPVIVPSKDLKITQYGYHLFVERENKKVTVLLPLPSTILALANRKITSEQIIHEIMLIFDIEKHAKDQTTEKLVKIISQMIEEGLIEEKLAPDYEK